MAHDLHLWWRDLEAKLHSRWDLLIYLAAEKRRNAPAAPTEEVDDQIRLQQADAIARLRT